MQEYSPESKAAHREFSHRTMILLLIDTWNGIGKEELLNAISNTGDWKLLNLSSQRS
jgi:hypothetical protein